MRDPGTRTDLEVEAAIEETRLFLEPAVRSHLWKGDPERRQINLMRALNVIAKNLPPEVYQATREPLLKAAKKRTHKPRLYFRDCVIAGAASRLIPRYLPSRNDATEHVEAASSIVRRALRRLGETTPREKTIKKIVLKYSLLLLD
jgi:hypothetical protein